MKLPDGLADVHVGALAGAAAAAAALGLAAYAGIRRPACAPGEKPEPPEASYLGVMAAWLRDPRTFDRALRRKYGECFSFTVGLWPFSKKVTMLAGPEASKLFHYSPAMSFSEGISQVSGRLMPERLFERDRVPIISRAVSANKFPAFVEIVADVARQLLAGMPEEGVGGDLFTFLVDTVFRMQVRILLGDDIFAVPGMFDRFKAAYDDLDPARRFREVLPSLRYLLGLDAGKSQRARGAIVGIAKELVERRLASGAAWEEDALRRYDLIGLSAKDPAVRRADGTYDEQELFCFIWGTVFGAVGNSAPSIGWLIYYLTKDKPALDKILGEWRAAVRESGGVSIGAVNRVERASWMVNELLRLSMPSISFRATTDPVEFAGKYRIPRGRLCCFLWNSINLNPDVYSDPLAFNPDRWETEGKEPGTNIVFGAGKHPCAGARVTYLEFKVLACVLLDALEVEPLAEPQVNYRQIIGAFRPLRPVPFRFRRRRPPGPVGQ